MIRFLCSAALAAALWCLFPAVVGRAADRPFSAQRNWLGPLADLNTALGARGRLPLAPLATDPEQAWLARLGGVLFRASDIFGETARRAGLSCSTCHAGGAATRSFFVAGGSGRPGTFDPRSAVFNPSAEAATPVKPISIPGLGGVEQSAPYGHDGRFATLSDFLRHAIVDEFGGAPPAPLVLDALLAFQKRLLPPVAPLLGADGKLTAEAPEAARLGEVLFGRPFPGREELSCAKCHPAALGFTDRQRHDVGTGGPVDTPSLRRGGLEPPYFHDARYDRLEEVIEHFSRHYSLDLNPATRRDLVAYLQVLRGTGETEAVTLASDLAALDETMWVIEQALARRLPAMVEIAANVARRELGAMHERFQGDGDQLEAVRAQLAKLARALRDAEAKAEQGSWLSAVEDAMRVTEGLTAIRPTLAAAERQSLYDAERRARFLANRN